MADSFNVKIDDGLRALCGLEEGHIISIVYEKVFCQYRRAYGIAENVEVLLDVGISVSIILPDVVSRKLGLRRLVQTRC